VLARPSGREALEALVHALSVGIPGVVGALPEADLFADLFTRAADLRVRERMELGIFRLDEVRPGLPPAGRSRPASAADRELLLAWLRAFHREVHPGSPWNEERTTRRLDHRIAGEGFDGIRVWDDRGPVCLAGYGARTPHGARIGPVYTPPERRRRGYASALVSELSGWLLSQGLRFCLLYADLANPTSTAIYRRIGYRLHCESVQIAFGPR
jgi:predicted GNAT family acetyltransferase